MEFHPLPRIPLTIHLWPTHKEFPARCTFTFEASIHVQLPLDIIWALAHVLIHQGYWMLPEGHLNRAANLWSAFGSSSAT